jgi:hypothetical protein
MRARLALVTLGHTSHKRKAMRPDRLSAAALGIEVVAVTTQVVAMGRSKVSLHVVPGSVSRLGFGEGGHQAVGGLCKTTANAAAALRPHKWTKYGRSSFVGRGFNQRATPFESASRETA